MRTAAESTSEDGAYCYDEDGQSASDRRQLVARGALSTNMT